MTHKVSEISFEQIEIGDTFEFSVVITENMIQTFAKLSGDFNPLHMDDNYANNSKFKKRISHGMLLISFVSRLIGMHLPGKNALILSNSSKFISPAHIGDEITVKGTIKSKSISTKIITVLFSITNEKHQKLVQGETKVLVRK